MCCITPPESVCVQTYASVCKRVCLYANVCVCVQMYVCAVAPHYNAVVGVHNIGLRCKQQLTRHAATDCPRCEEALLSHMVYKACLG